MAVTFKGNGIVYIPPRNRFIHFVGGEYATSDEVEIAVLSQRWEYDKDAPMIEQPPADDKPKRGRPRNVE
jgi:hypothetical protein